MFKINRCASLLYECGLHAESGGETRLFVCPRYAAQRSVFLISAGETWSSSSDARKIREFKQIATAGATTAPPAVTEKVWGEYVSVICQILPKRNTKMTET